ncbi:MAG: hypothetical protein A4E73_03009 [Syntrophaceae bacterium PtaU1.Bin231]|nr:MAG: hypothetical protein A4E73_03009 [Syntrophaceae bacterium PtaU1.Bin231]
MAAPLPISIVVVDCAAVPVAPEIIGRSLVGADALADPVAVLADASVYAREGAADATGAEIRDVPAEHAAGEFSRCVPDAPCPRDPVTVLVIVSITSGVEAAELTMTAEDGRPACVNGIAGGVHRPAAEGIAQAEAQVVDAPSQALFITVHEEHRFAGVAFRLSSHNRTCRNGPLKTGIIDVKLSGKPDVAEFAVVVVVIAGRVSGRMGGQRTLCLPHADGGVVAHGDVVAREESGNAVRPHIESAGRTVDRGRPGNPEAGRVAHEPGGAVQAYAVSVLAIVAGFAPPDRSIPQIMGLPGIGGSKAIRSHGEERRA